jgi:hypothetical protein
MSTYEFLHANIHDVAPSGDDIDPHVTTQENDEPSSSEDVNGMWLINAAKSSRSDHLPPGDIRLLLSKSSTRHANIPHIDYFVSMHEAILAHIMSLIDRGANDGVAGDDVRVIFQTKRTVNIKDFDNHHVNNNCWGSCAN